MKRLGVALSALLLVSATAQAADLNWNSGGGGSLYSPSPVSGWSGFYAGVNGGWGFGETERRSTSGGATFEDNTTGGVLGGQVGYNMDMGGFVVGAEADLQWSGIGHEDDIAGVGSFETGIDFFGTVRGRAGMSFGQVMPYVTAGFAAGRGTAALTNGGGVTTSQSANHMGWTVGAGLEAQAAPNLSIKAEYLYVDLGSQDYNGLPAGVGNVEIGERFSVVRAGLNYKF